MTRLTGVFLAMTLATTVGSTPSDTPWKPVPAPLMTRWAKEVTPENAHREYPRPQMTRPDWQSLNGLWEFADASPGQNPPNGVTLARRILVPFPVESALSGVAERGDRFWYRRTFEVPAHWKGRRTLLHFEACDWEARVWVNGKELGVHRGGYDPFSFDITPHLRPAGEQEVVVGVFDPTDQGHQARGKQVNNPQGIMYTPTSGLWQSVWIEPVPEVSIAGLRLTPDLDSGSLQLSVEMTSGTGATTSGLQVKAVALDGEREVGALTVAADQALSIPVEKARPWTPDDPFLYGLKVELLCDGKAIDSVDSYFGMRTIALGKDEKGINRLMLNGKPVFHIGPLDQGFWPDGLHTAPTDEALRWDIEFAKRLGFNMIRKHIKVEPARWYFWCDKLGVLVWQDMPSPAQQNAEERAQYERELERMLECRHNAPSIVMWVVWNEGWGQYDAERLTKKVKESDPSRLVNNASGWFDKKVGDVIDMHRYPGPGAFLPEPTRASVLGEFGGLGLGVDGHAWQKESFHYQGTESKEHLTKQYERLMRHVERLKSDPGLSAAVYTQTTDVEGEINGLVTYDREVVKVDEERVAKANRGELTSISLTYLAETGEYEPVTWKYTTDKPADGWEKPEFDAAAWKEGASQFGNEKSFLLYPRTAWDTPDIWLRRQFEIPDSMPEGKYAISIIHGDEAQVYVNGVKAAGVGGLGNYTEIELSKEAKAALRPGTNTIAVHARGGDAKVIDAGLILLKE